MDTSSPRLPPFPFPLPIKRGHDFISAAEREVLDEAKSRLILPRSPSPTTHERFAMMEDAMVKKKKALFLLASAQSDLETHASYLIEESGLDETIRFYDAHNDIGDDHTAIRRFVKAVSRITVSRPAVN